MTMTTMITFLLMATAGTGTTTTTTKMVTAMAAARGQRDRSWSPTRSLWSTSMGNDDGNASCVQPMPDSIRPQLQNTVITCEGITVPKTSLTTSAPSAAQRRRRPRCSKRISPGTSARWANRIRRRNCVAGRSLNKRASRGSKRRNKRGELRCQLRRRSSYWGGRAGCCNSINPRCAIRIWWRATNSDGYFAGSLTACPRWPWARWLTCTWLLRFCCPRWCNGCFVGRTD